jgi:ribA/ribD-fused uncharacterized protein
MFPTTDDMATPTEPVRFYGHSKAKRYWIFSNFASTPVTIDSITYPTTEHYFQSQKFASSDPEYSIIVREADDPYKTKALSKTRKHPIDPKWDTNRVEVMRVALLNKALQHPEFANTLLSTGEADIIEASPVDYFWGEGAKGNGANMLGKLLVELRERLKENIDTIYRDE